MAVFRTWSAAPQVGAGAKPPMFYVGVYAAVRRLGEGVVRMGSWIPPDHWRRSRRWDHSVFHPLRVASNPRPGLR